MVQGLWLNFNHGSNGKRYQVAFQGSHDRNSMLNNWSHGFSFLFAGEGVPVAFPAAARLFAGLATGVPNRFFNGDSLLFLLVETEYIGRRFSDCCLVGVDTWPDEPNPDGWPDYFIESAFVHHGPRSKSRLTTSNTCASSLSVWLASVGLRTKLGMLAFVLRWPGCV
jgi:hypothetical protein